MATAREKKVGSYCTRVFDDLTGMRSALEGYVHEIESMTGPEKELLITHIPHFRDLVHSIDWKLEILTRACPYEWTGFKDVEKGASVQLVEDTAKLEAVSGGYGGG